MALPQFAAMRKFAMSFRAILFGADPARREDSRKIGYSDRLAP